MAEHSRIEWTDQTWNVVTGCTRVSEGCDGCYADTFLRRWQGVPGHPFTTGFAPTVHPGRLGEPPRWRTPRRVFVAALGDLFHDAVPDEFIATVFTAMAATPQHTYQVLTKRPARMRNLLRHGATNGFLEAFAQGLIDRGFPSPVGVEWPLPNVGLGVSAENQKWADIRIPILRDTPAAWRWVSCEPMLSPIQLWEYLAPPPGFGPGLDWVVIGGESGPGARPFDLAAAADLVKQCQSYGVPVFVKQLGTAFARTHEQRGRAGDPDLWPPELRVRQYPTTTAAADAALSTQEQR